MNALFFIVFSCKMEHILKSHFQSAHFFPVTAARIQPKFGKAIPENCSSQVLSYHYMTEAYSQKFLKNVHLQRKDSGRNQTN